MWNCNPYHQPWEKERRKVSKKGNKNIRNVGRTLGIRNEDVRKEKRAREERQRGREEARNKGRQDGRKRG